MFEVLYIPMEFLTLESLDLGLRLVNNLFYIMLLFSMPLHLISNVYILHSMYTSFEIGNLIRACSSEDRFKSVQIKICITTRDGNQVMGNDFCKEMRFRPGEGRISRDNNKFL